MKVKMLFILALLFVKITIAQVSVGYYPFQSLLAVSTASDRLLWAEYKLETNTFMSNLNMELSPRINIKRTAQSKFYIGAGISINPINQFSELSALNGSFIDIGTRIKPLKTQPGFRVIFEISPYVNRTFDSGNLRTRLGLAWEFLK